MQASIQTQIDLTKGLYGSFNAIEKRIGNINASVSNQLGLLSQLTEALNKSTENFGRINSRLESLNNKLDTDLPQNINEDIKNETKKIEKKGKKIEKEITNSLKQTQKKQNNKLLSVSKLSRKSFLNLSSSIKDSKKTLEKFSNISNDSEKIVNSLDEARESINKVNDVSKSKGFLVTRLIFDSIKKIFSIIGRLTSLVFKFIKTIQTLPYQIAKGAVQYGNALRKDVVEVLGNAYEESKNFFDLTSNIGKSALKMKKFASGSLLSMQSANSKFTKLFGFGTQAGAAFQKFLIDATQSMGHFAELYGPAVMQNGKAAFYLIESMKTLNITNEQLSYYAQDADVHTGNLFTTLDKTREAISSASSSHGLDFKMLAINFHKLRTNIIEFGHLTSEAVADLTARATKMGVKVEELTNVFKKFTSFEDAANTSAKLFQSFGMGLDALKLLTANDPGEILEMISDSMQATGKTFDTLNRHERKLMQETTGLSAETLKSIMNYRAQGLTFEEARKKVQQNDPTEEMTKTVKGLTGAIRQIQKIMEFQSPFDAFFKGLKANILANGKSIESLTGLSVAYDRLYHFGLTLDKKSFNAILIPVTAIIERLHAIFTSSGFLDTLSFGVRSIGDLLQNVTRKLSGSKLSQDINTLYDRLSALTYKSSGHQNAFKNIFQGALNTISRDSSLKKYLASSGIIDKNTGKIMSTIGHDVIMQTLINAGDKLPSAQGDIRTIVTTLNNAFNKQSLKGIGWSNLGIKGRIDRVKFSLKKLWDKRSPWADDLFKLGGTIMGALIKGTIVGLTAIMKLMSGEINNYYVQSNSILYDVMKKSAISQGKGAQFNKGEYGLFDFLGLPTNFNDTVMSRLSKSITHILFSPSLYKILGSLTFAIYKSLLPIAHSLANMIVELVAKTIDKKGGMTSVAADFMFPELTSAGRASKSKEPQIISTTLKNSLALKNKKNKINFNTNALIKMQNDISSGEFAPHDWLGGKTVKTAAAVAAGYGTYALGAAAVAKVSSMGAVGGLLTTGASVLTGGLTIAVAGAAYVAWDYWHGDSKIIEAKRKKAIAQTMSLEIMEKHFYDKVNAKNFDPNRAADLKDRWKNSKAFINAQLDENKIIDYEHAYEYPSGYLYPAYVVSPSGKNELINTNNYYKFGKDEDNVRKIKDGIIKSLPGKGLVFFDGKQNILFDENDTVELIASKSGGALMEYFNQIDRKYENNVKTLKSRLFDSSKETIDLIEKDIKEKIKIADVIDKTTKVINKIISYNEKEQHLIANISVQGS